MLDILFFIIGLVLLVKGADFLIDGATELADKLRVSKLVVGLTIVAFGTSAPELFINMIAAFQGQTDIAVGNIVGSNISNILLILGVMLSLTKITVSKDVIKNEVPYSFFAAAILLVLAFVQIGGKQDSLSLIEGMILIAFFGYYVLRMLKLAKKGKKKLETKDAKGRNYWLISANIVGGIAGLYLGGQLVVNGAINIATMLGVSEYTISVSVVAVGTSLPELVTGIVSVMKKQLDIGVGNIVGSNIFNIFWVLGVTAIIRETIISYFAIADIIILLMVTASLYGIMRTSKKMELTRTHGILFLVLYAVYVIFLFVR